MSTCPSCCTASTLSLVTLGFLSQDLLNKTELMGLYEICLFILVFKGYWSHIHALQRYIQIQIYIIWLVLALVIKEIAMR